MEVFDHPQEYKSRLGGLCSLYMDMCEREYSQFITSSDLFEKQTKEYLKHEYESECTESGIKTIIFSALSVEAGINDYGAWQLGDKYFEGHLSSLDVVSKWVVVPKLVCGKEIDKSGPAFSALRSLIKSRNELVHNKSKDFSLNDPELHLKLKKRSEDFSRNIHNAYRALVLLSLQFDALIGATFNPLRSFNKDIHLTIDTPENLLGTINDCKKIISRNNL